MPHGMAIIGLGVIGKRMIEQCAAHGGFTIAAAWDSSSASRGNIAREFPHVPIATSLRDAVERLDVDVVYVGVPPLYQLEFIEAAASAGKAVFCEKPLLVATGERLSGKVQVRNAVNYGFASSAAAQTLVRRVRAPEFGLAAAQIRLRYTQWPRLGHGVAAWHKLAGQGGPTREVLSHYFYLLSMIFSDVRLVASRSTSPVAGQIETASSAILDCDGIIVTATATVGGSLPDEISAEFHGATETLRLTASHEPDGSQLDQLTAWLDDKPHALPDIATSLKVQRIMETILLGDTA